MHRIILKRSSGLFMGNDVPHIIEWSGLAIIDRDSLYQWLYEKNKSVAKRIEGNSIVILRVLHQSMDVPSVRFTDDGGRWLM